MQAEDTQKEDAVRVWQRNLYPVLRDPEMATLMLAPTQKTQQPFLNPQAIACKNSLVIAHTNMAKVGLLYIKQA